MARHVCGIISQYVSTKPQPRPINLILATTKRLTLDAFIVSDHLDLQPIFFTDTGRWIKEKRIEWKETIFDGIESAPKAFIGLFKGEKFGKMPVKIGLDPAL